MDPIETWTELVRAEANEQELQRRLTEMYRKNRPFIAAIIMNSRCSSRCLHCIYAPDYERYNRNMTGEQWKTAFQAIYEKTGIKRFIFDGRAITRECIEAVRYLKENFPDVKVGLIADGISLEPFAAALVDCPPDWLDVSVDGLEEAHDIQRNNKGAYRKTIDILMRLKESGAFEKINILTCLTNLNMPSITGMIRELNARGFKNFFIAPVNLLKGYRPDPGLQPTQEDFIRWLDELIETAGGLSDAWVEVDIYDARYARAIKQLKPDLFRAFKPDHEHLTIKKTHKDNEFHISYYPASLTGARELIINSNGDVIPPRVMAMGDIPADLVMGNICTHPGNGSFLDSANGGNALRMFFGDLLEERNLLGH